MTFSLICQRGLFQLKTEYNQAVADRRVPAGCEVLREAGILVGILYPLEKSISHQIDWFWLTFMEVFAAILVVCGILLDKEEE